MYSNSFRSSALFAITSLASFSFLGSLVPFGPFNFCDFDYEARNFFVWVFSLIGTRFQDFNAHLYTGIAHYPPLWSSRLLQHNFLKFSRKISFTTLRSSILSVQLVLSLFFQIFHKAPTKAPHLLNSSRSLFSTQSLPMSLQLRPTSLIPSTAARVSQVQMRSGLIKSALRAALFFLEEFFFFYLVVRKQYLCRLTATRVFISSFNGWWSHRYFRGRFLSFCSHFESRCLPMFRMVNLRISEVNIGNIFSAPELSMYKKSLMAGIESSSETSSFADMVGGDVFGARDIG